MNSSPVPSNDRLIATTTMRARVIVRFRRRPIQISWRTNCARILTVPRSPASCGGAPAVCLMPATVPRGSGYGTSVRLAVNTARLVPDHLAVLELDDALTHGVDDRGVVRGHDHGGAGPVDAVE